MDKNKKFKVAVYGPNLPTSGPTFHIHTVDCADRRKKRLYREIDAGYEASWEMDVDNRIEICDGVYTPGEFECKSGDYLYDFKIFPCCKAIPMGEPKPNSFYGLPDDWMADE